MLVLALKSNTETKSLFETRDNVFNQTLLQPQGPIKTQQVKQLKEDKTRCIRKTIHKTVKQISPTKGGTYTSLSINKSCTLPSYV